MVPGCWGGGVMGIEWYDPDGYPLGRDLSAWSDHSAGGTWDRERIKTAVEGGYVSTVWLGLDHSYGDGPPLIFETMAFCDGPLDQTQDRYSTREQARKGHDRMAERVKAERAAWRELLADEKVRDCARVVAEALTSHTSAHTGSDYGLGDRFEEFVRAMGTAS